MANGYPRDSRRDRVASFIQIHSNTLVGRIELNVMDRQTTTLAIVAVRSGFIEERVARQSAPIKFH